jgi:hypothetical protein
LTAAIAVVAPSAVPSIALDFTGVKAPIDPSTTSQIYTSLTDVTPYAGGMIRYREICQTVAARDYEGFVLS